MSGPMNPYTMKMDLDCLLERFDKFEYETNRRLEALEPKVTFVVNSEGKPVRRASEQEIEAIRQSQAMARGLKKLQDDRIAAERDAFQSKLDEIRNVITTEGYYPAAAIRRILDK
jgi:hypothetical protein